MKTQVIIPMAGMGVRFKSDIPKPLVMLKDKPIFIHTLEVFEKSCSVDSILVVAHKEKVEEFMAICQQYGLKKIKKIVVGGETRYDSVHNGLQNLDEDTEVVIVHDGARPLVTGDVIAKSIRLCKQYKAVIVAVPMKPTVKRVDIQNMVVEQTLDRSKLWEVQTPQVFKRDVILQAHSQAQDSSATDDAFLVEQMGLKVKVLEGSYRNIKITTQEDLALAEVFVDEI